MVLFMVLFIVLLLFIDVIDAIISIYCTYLVTCRWYRMGKEGAEDSCPLLDSPQCFGQTRCPSKPCWGSSYGAILPKHRVKSSPTHCSSRHKGTMLETTIRLLCKGRPSVRERDMPPVNTWQFQVMQRVGKVQEGDKPILFPKYIKV